MKKSIIVCIVLLLSGVVAGQSRLAGLVAGGIKKEASDSSAAVGKKKYNDVITKDAVTEHGIMNIHKVKKVYYLEIPFQLLGKPMLLAGRVSEISANREIIAGQMPRDPLYVTWDADEDRVYLLDASGSSVCDPSEQIAIGFARNNLKPVYKAFPIRAVNPDSTAVVIDVSKFFCGDEKHLTPFTPSTPFDKLFGVSRLSGSFKADMSSILAFKSYPNNITFKTRMVYTVSDNPFTALMTTSMLILPDEPMRPRYEDKRLGIFSEGKVLYSENKDGTERMRYINRWNLSPRAEDVERHKRGELVVPEKPIVYWVDNAFPEKWRPYLKEGIEDWQLAFEAIGFKDAIVARDYPSDANFDPEDMRNSCLIYASVPIANAMGPSWVDPRSGEIIQGSVYFYHDVLKLLHNWRFIQTATVDPDARKEVYDMHVMGPLLRYLVAHEIGHTLGLMHNMRGSYAYPVDSLRSPSFTEKYGTTASIMDYARYNYVAQPGDGVTQLLPPRLGLYDYFVIKWAYSPIYGTSTAEEEKAVLNSWILEKSGDPIYQYGAQEVLSSVDPASQSESLGDDAIKAGEYGVRNLKVLMDNLIRWTVKEGEDYKYTEEMYNEVFKQFKLYMSHAVKYIGGNYLQNPVYGDGKPGFIPVEKSKQKEALAFVIGQVKELPEWLLKKELLTCFEPKNDAVHDYQMGVVRSLTSLSLLGEIGATAKNSSDPYTQEEYLDDLYNLIFESTQKGRNLSWGEQKMEYAYIHTLFGGLNLYEAEVTASKSLADDVFETERLSSAEYDELIRRSGTERSVVASTKESDLKVNSMSIVYSKLEEIQKLINRKAKNSGKEMKRHYSYLNYELSKALKK